MGPRTFAASLLLAGSALSCSTPRDPQPKQIEEQVVQRFESLADAVVALDIEAYLAHFDRDAFTSLEADGTVHDSFDGFAEQVAAGFSVITRYEDLQFPTVEVRVLDADTAILINQFKARLEVGDSGLVESDGAGSQVWQRRDGEWFLVHVGSSVPSGR